MIRTLKRLFVVLAVIAISGAAVGQAAPVDSGSGPVLAIHGAGHVDCMAAMGQGDGQGPSGKSQPCKSCSHDCAMVAACVCLSALLAQVTALASAALLGRAVYWETPVQRTGLSILPSPFPPIAV